MTDENHVDGNALGGLFVELFGHDMTGALGRCNGCGSVRVMAEAHVFRDAPGDVLRCTVCAKVLMVIVPVPPAYRVTFETLGWIQVSREVEAGSS